MLGRQGLIPVAEACALLLKQLGSIKTDCETVPLEDALDRVTAAPLLATEDLPPAARSTMDGFAVIAADTYGATQSMPAYLNITGEVVMGEVPSGKLAGGQCYRIPTGGLLPAGADSVVMLEHSIPVDGHMVEIVKDVGSGTNVIGPGDDIRRGAAALPAGRRIRPQDLGLLAGLGITEVTVHKPATVGIIASGDEIVDYRSPAHPGKIRNINSITLTGLVRRCGGTVRDYGIAADTETSFFSTVERAVSETDLVLFSGGSSVGMRDLGEQAIERLGAPGILVHGVALKPGKPVIIGMAGTVPVFGLPGHPVSAMVCFDFFVRPALRAISGYKDDEREVTPSVGARLKRNINSAAGRLDVVRVQLRYENGEYCAYPVLGRSGAISTMSKADGFFLIDESSQGQSIDDLIEVVLYQ